MNKQQGFSLLEILVAFSILAMALGILLRIFSTGINNAQVAEGYSTALQIAESLMARTGVETPLQEGVSNGILGEIYEWQVNVSPYLSPDLPEDQENIPVKLMEVSVNVSWDGDYSEPRIVELKTLKIVYKKS